MTKNIKYAVILSAIFLIVFGELHFLAYSHDVPDRSSGSVAVIFALYYLSWILVVAFNYYLMKKYIPKYGYGILIPIFIIGVSVWIPCASLIDGMLNIIIIGGEMRSAIEILSVFNALSYHNKFVTYCFLFGAIAFVVYYRLYQNTRIRMLEQEKQSADAKFAVVQQRLTSLQSQLAPHFLFNCLNMLSGLARMGQRDELVFAIARLGDLLRFVSVASGNNCIRLSEEIEFVHDYVDLQKIRFGDTNG